MEYYKGLRSLEKFIRFPDPRVNVGPEVRTQIALKIFKELSKLHISGIYNNNLMTNNILVSYEPKFGAHVKFVDWTYYTDNKKHRAIKDLPVNIFSTAWKDLII